MEAYFTAVKWIMTALLGLCIGSFLNVVIYRVPENMSLATPPSHCPKCGYRLKPYDNIPVFSYIFLGGKCRKCREPISPRYMIVELANMALWMLCLGVFGKDSLIFAAVAALAISNAICIFFIDLETMLIYDRFQIIFAVLGAAAAFLDGYEPFWMHFIAAFVFGGAFLLLGVVGKRVFGKDALGGGDVKLAACIGLFLGLGRTLLAVMVSSLVASIVLIAVRRRNGDEKGKEYPFGPFLTSGFAFALLFGEQIIEAYMGLFA